MVVESILNPQKIEKRSIEMIIFGFIIASLAILLSIWVFPSYAGFAMVTFTVMATLPLMVKTIKIEKEKQDKKKNLGIMIYKSFIVNFLFLFLGFLLAFTLWFLLLPMDIANHLFSIQINTLAEINSPSGAVTILFGPTFTKILLNNLRVLALSIIFSFIFASGAIFILTWNASVLGVGMANTIKLSIASTGTGSAAYFGAVSFSLVRYLIHGIPEITSYFIGGLAGGIISFAILDYKLGFKTFFKKFSKSLKTVTTLIILAITLLVFSALIEVYLVPLITQ